jgi:hypothetical protein
LAPRICAKSFWVTICGFVLFLQACLLQGYLTTTEDAMNSENKGVFVDEVIFYSPWFDMGNLAQPEFFVNKNYLEFFVFFSRRFF